MIRFCFRCKAFEKSLNIVEETARKTYRAIELSGFSPGTRRAAFELTRRVFLVDMLSGLKSVREDITSSQNESEVTNDGGDIQGSHRFLVAVSV